MLEWNVLFQKVVILLWTKSFHFFAGSKSPQAERVPLQLNLITKLISLIFYSHQTGLKLFSELYHSF